MKTTPSLESLDRHFLVVTSLLVIALGVPTLYSVLKEPQKSDARLAIVGASVESGIQRQPSNVVTGNKGALTHDHDLVAANQGKSISIDVPCDAKDLGQLQASHLRLLGSLCGDSKDEVQIKNLSNGFTAQVISLRDEKFTTDFIDLKEGINQLQIIRKNAQGHNQEQQIQVNRLPASLEEPAPETARSAEQDIAL